MNHAVIANQLSTIRTPTRFNYPKWKRDIELTLGLMDLDLALIESVLGTPDADSSIANKLSLENGRRQNS